MLGLRFGVGVDGHRLPLGGTSGPTPITKVTFEGDSITYDQDPFTRSYAKFWKDNNPTLTVNIDGVTNAGVGYPSQAGSGANSLWGRANTVITEAPHLLHILIGPNDLSGYNNWTGVGPTGPQTGTNDWYSNLMAYIAYIRASVPGVLVFVGGTMPMSNSYVGGQGPTHNARYLTVCGLLRAEVGARIDGYTPFGDALVPADFDVAANSSDGLHPDTDIRRLMQRIITATLDPVIALSTGSVPSAITFTDQNNVPLSTISKASAIVTGMGRGASASVTRSGSGTFARGAATQGTTGFSVMNGDIINVELTGSATNNTDVSETVAAGGVSDTFTGKSAVTSPITFASSSAVLHDVSADGDHNTPHSFSVSFPGGRALVAVDTYYQNASAVTFNGVTLTRLDGAGPPSLWIAPSSMNLAAGTYTLVVTCPGFTMVEAWAQVGGIVGCSQATGSMVARKIDWNFLIQGTQFANGAANIVSGGLFVAISYENAASSFSAKNATVERTYAAFTDNTFVSIVPRWVTSRVSQVPSITTQGNYGSLVGVCLEP